MANALGFSRMALASARAFPFRRGNVLPAAASSAYRGGNFGARMPASRLFAYTSNNGNGRGATTSTAAAPKDRAGAANAKGPGVPAAVSAAKTKHAEQVTELTFAPFDEVKKPLEELREAEGRDVSLAREEGYSAQLEDAVNYQINIELTIRCVAAARAIAQLLHGFVCACASHQLTRGLGRFAATSITACTPTLTATMWLCVVWPSTSARCQRRSANTPRA